MTGKLRQKIRIRSQVDGNADGQGGVYNRFTDGSFVFAHIERISRVGGGNKEFLYNQIYEGELYEVILRYDTAKNVKQGDDKFLWDDRELIIHHSFQVKPETTRRQQSDRYIGFICSVKNE